MFHDGLSIEKYFEKSGEKERPLSGYPIRQSVIRSQNFKIRRQSSLSPSCDKKKLFYQTDSTFYPAHSPKKQSTKDMFPIWF